MKSKVFITALAVALVLVVAVGGTVAWLQAKTAAVINTFTYGDIDITLAETDDGDDDANANRYKMIPGNTISKDPVVTVLADSEACWLFVKLEKSANFDSFMTYAMADGWDALDGVANVYYREVEAVTVDTPFGVIKDNAVTVKDEVRKEDLNALDSGENAANPVYPTLTITAYAVQRSADNAAIDTAPEAWALANAG